MANITDYRNTGIIDANIRKYTAAANQIAKVPIVSVNNRFRYSPKTITIASSLYGLLDKTAVVPYEYDPVALYSALRDYQKFPQVGYKYFPVGGVPDQPWAGESGVEETACDFRILYTNVPPPNATHFMKGVRAIDLDMHVTNMINYSNQTVNPATLWTPFWNGYYHTQSNEWSWTDNSNVEYGVMCGPVHYLRTVDYAMTGTDNQSKLNWTYLSAQTDTESVPSTFDDLWELRNIADKQFYWKDFTVPALSGSMWDAEVLPKKPEEDGIIDFRVDFDVTRSGSGANQQTTVNATYNMPLKVAFSNLTPYNIEIILYCHPYNWWFRQNRNGSYSKAPECRNSLTFTSYDLNEVKAVAAARNPQNTFYDFGTGLRYIDGSRPGYNVFYLEPFETANLIEIDESTIWRSDSHSAKNFHGMRNGWERTDAGVETISDNPLAGGTYGFWIDLNECFFRIVDEIPEDGGGGDWDASA